MAIQPVDVVKNPWVMPEPQWQTEDGRRVNPYFCDTLALHPAADSANGDAGKTSDTPCQPAPAQSIWSRVHDFASWMWGLVFPQGKTEQLDEKVRLQDRATRAEVDQFIEEMRGMVRRIKDGTEDTEASLCFEALLFEIFKAQAKDKEEEAFLTKEQLARHVQDRQSLTKERLQKLDAVLASNRSSRVWGLFEKAAAGFGTAAAAVGVSSAWGVVAFCFGVGLVADQLFDDALKKRLAASVTSDKESESKYLGYLQLGCGLATCALFLGLTGPKQAFNTVASLAKGCATTGKGLAEYNSNSHQATMQEVSNLVTKQDDHLKTDQGSIKNTVEAVYRYYREMSLISEHQNETAQAVLRR